LAEKHVLRKAFQDWLPPEIGSRPKRPYRAPIRDCFVGPHAPDYVGDLLCESALRKSAIFNVEAVRHLVAKLTAGNATSETDEMALVGILSTQLLFDQFKRRIQSGDPIGESDRVKVVDQRGMVSVK
jgi:asparagine synthase (glutamine-hydrolysing)